MGFLKRLIGGTSPDPVAAAPVDPAEADADERARELEMLREDQDRLDDLAQRQLRYARYAWQPPAQGGERRADDADATPTG